MPLGSVSRRLSEDLILGVVVAGGAVGTFALQSGDSGSGKSGEPLGFGRASSLVGPSLDRSRTGTRCPGGLSQFQSHHFDSFGIDVEGTCLNVVKDGGDASFACAFLSFPAIAFLNSSIIGLYLMRTLARIFASIGYRPRDKAPHLIFPLFVTLFLELPTANPGAKTNHLPLRSILYRMKRLLASRN